MKVKTLIKELENLNLEGDILFFDGDNFYLICERSIEKGERLFINELRQTYCIKIEKK